MKEEYYNFKKVKPDCPGEHYERKTKEVFVEVSVNEGRLNIQASGDLRHHILEDTIIVLKKILGGHENL